MFYPNRVCSSLLFLVAPLGGLHLTLGIAAGNGPVITGPGECESCHTQLQEEWLRSSVANLNYDEHFKWGMGCVDCHGGDQMAREAMAAHDPEKGYIGVPDALDIPALCAHCHADARFMATQNPGLPVDQYAKYWTSQHGELLKMRMRKVAQCASCHTAHNIRPASDPNSTVYPANVPRTCASCHSDSDYMAGYRIPTNQFEKYRYSVHGLALLDEEDIAAPACNDCHGNHGAAPPGFTSVSHVCGMCHSLVAEHFEASPHAEPFEEKGIGQCSACHGYHAIAPPSHTAFNMGPESVCITCHQHEDAGWNAGKQLFSMLNSLDEMHGQVRVELANAQNLGMDVSEGSFLLQDFRAAALMLRTLVHGFDMPAIEEKAQEAAEYVSEAGMLASDAVEEFYFRRKGLLAAFLLSIPVVIFLTMKIRSLDRSPGMDS